MGVVKVGGPRRVRLLRLRRRSVGYGGTESWMRTTTRMKMNRIMWMCTTRSLWVLIMQVSNMFFPGSRVISRQLILFPLSIAIRTFHSDRARYHDLFNNGFPYLQTHLAFLDDLQYSGLWTITEIPSISPLPTLSNPFAGGGIADDESALLTTSDNLASSSLLGSPADGPSRSDSMEQERRGRISPGRLSSSYSEPDSLNGSAADLGQDLQAGSQPEVVPPINLREYWKSHVFPLRHDDLATLGPSEVRFKITESLHRDGRSSAIKDSGPSSTRPSTSAPSRPSRLARELTEEMLDGPQSPVDDFKDGKTPMNHGSEQSKEFPFDGRSEGTETPVNRSRSPMGRSDRQDEKVEGKEMWNRAYYIKAVEVLIALAELVKVSFTLFTLALSLDELTESTRLSPGTTRTATVYSHLSARSFRGQALLWCRILHPCIPRAAHNVSPQADQ